MADGPRAVEALVRQAEAGLVAPARGVEAAQLCARRAAHFHAAAAEDFPCLIVGMGRWGRVLAGVLAEARGHGRGLGLLARSNRGETADWAADRLPEATVYGSFDEAETSGFLHLCAASGYAIVASVPAQHHADWARLRDAGAAVLVEKPLAVDMRDIETMLAAAKSGPVTGLGIELSMLPVWPWLRALCGPGISLIRIDWEDPAGEVRHGAVKRSHRGVDATADIASHVASILGHFCAVPELGVRGAERAGPDGAVFRLDGPASLRVDLALDKAGQRRRRSLEVRAESGRWTVDFAERVAVLRRDGRIVPLPDPLAAFDSSLTLELGGFLCRVRSAAEAVPIVDWLEPSTRFQQRLTEALAAEAAR